jgi:ABC-type transporter Mla maintaining outer membrane lipid asymmetry permease subunit MlaE
MGKCRVHHPVWKGLAPGERRLLRMAYFRPVVHRVNLFFHIGRYFLLLGETFSRPERISLYWKRILEEADLLGVKSLGIVALLSVFMGAVITIQTKTNIDSPLIPLYVVGFTARQSTILEFSPTIISLILAGKVGSTIAAEIGSMPWTSWGSTPPGTSFSRRSSLVC